MRVGNFLSKIELCIRRNCNMPISSGLPAKKEKMFSCSFCKLIHGIVFSSSRWMMLIMLM